MSGSGFNRVWGVLLILLISQAGMAAEPIPPIAIGFYLPVLRDVPRQDAELSLKFWVNEMAASLNTPFKPIRFYENMADIKRDMSSGEINMMVATSMGVVQHFSMGEIRGGFSGLKTTPDYLCLIVRRAAGIHRLADLAGKRVAILDQDELSSVYLETLLLKTWGATDIGKLSSLVKEKRSSNLPYRLFFNKADAVLVSRNAYETAVALNPQMNAQVQVLEAYTFKGRSPHIALFSSRVPAAQTEAVVQRVTTIFGNTPRGRQVLDIYHADNLARTDPSDLEPFIALLAENRALKNASKYRKKKRDESP